MKLQLLASTLFALAALPLSAASTLINIDFKTGSGSMSGAAVLGAAGDVWNAPNTNPSSSAAVFSLVDSSNAAAGSLTYYSGTAGNGSGFNAGTGANPAALMDGIAGSANGGSGTSYAQITFEFTGLLANTTYDIVAYGASTAGTDRGTLFFNTVGGSVLGSTTGGSVDIAGGAGTAYTTFQLTTDGSGAFNILTNYNSASSAQGPVNGFQLQAVAVPEPSWSVLASFGLVSLALRRRRHAH
ncbi:MAG: hypothetical protein KDK99_11065 [Verrucomicrobiales bacterium]|nr:hypothetical protein [Verrucomicrobiales bacterium]